MGGEEGEFTQEKNKAALRFALGTRLHCFSLLAAKDSSCILFLHCFCWWEAKSTREPVSDSSSFSSPLLGALSPLCGVETRLRQGLTLPPAFSHFSFLILPLKKQTEANPTLSLETLSWLILENMQIIIICPIFSFSVPHFSSLGD